MARCQCPAARSMHTTATELNPQNEPKPAAERVRVSHRKCSASIPRVDLDALSPALLRPRAPFIAVHTLSYRRSNRPCPAREPISGVLLTSGIRLPICPDSATSFRLSLRPHLHPSRPYLLAADAGLQVAGDRQHLRREVNLLVAQLHRQAAVLLRPAPPVTTRRRQRFCDSVGYR